jgi:DNA-binding beta-propeller fold protein YncE
VDRATGRLCHWNASSRTLTRIDLATGRVTGTATAAQASAGFPDAADRLAALGRSVGQWLAPAAAAKTILQPSIALSPDGSRAYALGVTSPATTDAGSTGVDVFDTVAMRAIDHWAPLADLVSVGTSPDGRYVYVAGAPEVDATGARRIGAPASLIVFDASDGTVRLIAGALGLEMATIVP